MRSRIQRFRPSKKRIRITNKRGKDEVLEHVSPKRKMPPKKSLSLGVPPGLHVLLILVQVNPKDRLKKKSKRKKSGRSSSGGSKKKPTL